MPTPKPPWYQFSLRSLLLFSTFIAVLCSIGVCTHWLISLLIGLTVVVGGGTGRIVAGTRLGFVRGAVFGIEFFLIGSFVCVLPAYAFRQLPQTPWLVGAAILLAVLIGGILGGFTVRPRSGR